MSTGVELDSRQLDRLGRDLAAAGLTAVPMVAKVLVVAGTKMKKRMRDEARGSQYLRRVPQSITFTTSAYGTGLQVEVGPEVGRGQGSLAWVGYEGTATRGPVFPDPQGLLDDEATVVERLLSGVLEDGLG